MVFTQAGSDEKDGKSAMLLCRADSEAAAKIEFREKSAT